MTTLITVGGLVVLAGLAALRMLLRAVEGNGSRLTKASLRLSWTKGCQINLEAPVSPTGIDLHHPVIVDAELEQQAVPSVPIEPPAAPVWRRRPGTGQADGQLSLPFDGVPPP